MKLSCSQSVIVSRHIASEKFYFTHMRENGEANNVVIVLPKQFWLHRPPKMVSENLQESTFLIQERLHYSYNTFFLIA